jgi:hypothetical protein
MMIKDLEMSKELANDELSAVRGGGNVANVGGLSFGNFNFDQDGRSSHSPVSIDFHPINAPTVAQYDNDTTVDVDLTTITGSRLGGLRSKLVRL